MDENGVPLSYAKRLKELPAQINQIVLETLTKLVQFLYEYGGALLPDTLYPYEIAETSAVYLGKWKDGKRHGPGLQIWPDGVRYDGYWKNNKAKGKGRHIHANG